MALVIVAVLAAQYKDAVHAFGQGFLDPDDIDGPQAANRNQPDIRGKLQTVQAGNVNGRIGVVFTDQAENPHGRIIKVIC